MCSKELNIFAGRLQEDNNMEYPCALFDNQAQIVRRRGLQHHSRMDRYLGQNKKTRFQSKSKDKIGIKRSPSLPAY